MKTTKPLFTPATTHIEKENPHYAPVGDLKFEGSETAKPAPTATDKQEADTDFFKIAKK
jgi:hypothetical protein